MRCSCRGSAAFACVVTHILLITAAAQSELAELRGQVELAVLVNWVARSCEAFLAAQQHQQQKSGQHHQPQAAGAARRGRGGAAVSSAAGGTSAAAGPSTSSEASYEEAMRQLQVNLPPHRFVLPCLALPCHGLWCYFDSLHR